MRVKGIIRIYNIYPDKRPRLSQDSTLGDIGTRRTTYSGPEHTRGHSRHEQNDSPALTCLKIAGPQNSIDGLVQDCSNSIALAMELLQSCT